MHINIFSVIEFVTFGPNFVFDVSSSNNFRRLLDQVDLSQFAVLLWLFIVIILLAYVSGYMPFMSSDYVDVICSYSLNFAGLLELLRRPHILQDELWGLTCNMQLKSAAFVIVKFYMVV